MWALGGQDLEGHEPQACRYSHQHPDRRQHPDSSGLSRLSAALPGVQRPRPMGAGCDRLKSSAVKNSAARVDVVAFERAVADRLLRIIDASGGQVFFLRRKATPISPTPNSTSDEGSGTSNLT